MKLDDLVFTTIIPSRSPSSIFISIRERNGTLILGLSVGAQELCKKLNPNYNGIELLAANESVFGIKPIKKPKGSSQKQFSVTSLNGKIKNIRLNKRLYVELYKGMIVCDLTRNII